MILIMILILLLCICIYLTLIIKKNVLIQDDFIQLDTYPELNLLKENYHVILDELNYVIENGYWSNYDILHGKDVFRNKNSNFVISEMEKFESKIEEKSKEPKWKIFGLLLNKNTLEKNEKICPKTISILKSIPYIINAGFSCLEPNKSTDKHKDDNDLFYRYQLPLIIPEGDTGFKVGNSVIDYKVNEAFIFDDCMYHQAWNNTDKIRIVLICDIDRKKQL